MLGDVALPLTDILCSLIALGYDSAKGDRLKLGIATVCAAMLVLTSCGGGGDSTSDSSDDGGTASAGANTADIDVCSLLSDEEITAALGSAPASEPTEPADPFTGCKWGSGLLYVQIAPAVTLITAPTETDCDSAGVGEESRACPGSVKFLTNGIHASISTIQDRSVSADQLLAVAMALEPKLNR